MTSTLAGAEAAASKRVARHEAISHMEAVLGQYEAVLHPTNYVMLSLKLKLGCLLGNLPPHSALAAMTREQLQRKLRHCQEAAAVLDTLDPGSVGESVWRDRLRREITRSSMLLKQIKSQSYLTCLHSSSSLSSSSSSVSLAWPSLAPGLVTAASLVRV